jgi:hypothetical protein
MTFDEPYCANAIIRHAYQDAYAEELSAGVRIKGVVLTLTGPMSGTSAASHLNSVTKGDISAAYFGGRTKKEPFEAARAAVSYAQAIVNRKVDEDGWSATWTTGDALRTEFKHAKFQLLAPAWFERWNGRPTKMAVAIPTSFGSPTSYWLGGVMGVAGGHWMSAGGLKGVGTAQHQSHELARNAVKSALWGHILRAEQNAGGDPVAPVWMLPHSFTGVRVTGNAGLWDSAISKTPPDDLRKLPLSHWLTQMLKSQSTSDSFEPTADVMLHSVQPKLFFFQGRRFGLLLDKPGRSKKVK